jgi:hypothetical protein
LSGIDCSIDDGGLRPEVEHAIAVSGHCASEYAGELQDLIAINCIQYLRQCSRAEAITALSTCTWTAQEVKIFMLLQHLDNGNSFMHHLMDSCKEFVELSDTFCRRSGAPTTMLRSLVKSLKLSVIYLETMQSTSQSSAVHASPLVLRMDVGVNTDVSIGASSVQEAKQSMGLVQIPSMTISLEEDVAETVGGTSPLGSGVAQKHCCSGSQDELAVDIRQSYFKRSVVDVADVANLGKGKRSRLATRTVMDSDQGPGPQGSKTLSGINMDTEAAGTLVQTTAQSTTVRPPPPPPPPPPFPPPPPAYALLPQQLPSPQQPFPPLPQQSPHRPDNHVSREPMPPYRTTTIIKPEAARGHLPQLRIRLQSQDSRPPADPELQLMQRPIVEEAFEGLDSDAEARCTRAGTSGYQRIRGIFERTDMLDIVDKLIEGTIEGLRCASRSSKCSSSFTSSLNTLQLGVYRLTAVQTKLRDLRRMFRGNGYLSSEEVRRDRMLAEMVLNTIEYCLNSEYSTN